MMLKLVLSVSFLSLIYTYSYATSFNFTGVLSSVTYSGHSTGVLPELSEGDLFSGILNIAPASELVYSHDNVSIYMVHVSYTLDFVGSDFFINSDSYVGMRFVDGVVTDSVSWVDYMPIADGYYAEDAVWSFSDSFGLACNSLADTGLFYPSFFDWYSYQVDIFGADYPDHGTPRLVLVGEVKEMNGPPVQPIPEPETLYLFLLGICGMVFCLKRYFV